MQYRADRTPQLTLRRVAVRPALVVCTMPARQTNLKSNFILNFSEKKCESLKNQKTLNFRLFQILGFSNPKKQKPKTYFCQPWIANTGK